MNFYILSGGKSSRMGTNKARLLLGQKSMIEVVRDALPAPSGRIAVIANSEMDYANLGLRMVRDLYPGIGPLAGIHAGLTDSNFQCNFFIACDMPLVTAGMIELLITHYSGEDILGFRSPSGPEPLCAIYSKSCLPSIVDHIKQGEYSLQDLIATTYSRFISYAESARLANINSPADLELVRQRQVNSTSGT